MNHLRKKVDPPLAPAPPPFERRAVASALNPVQTVVIDESSDGQRLDNLLIRLLKGVPRSHLQQLIRSGQVRVNGGRTKSMHKLALGDKVRVPPVRVAAVTQRHVRPSEFPIVFEDDGLLVIDKPDGVAVHGGSGVSSGVIERLRAARPEQSFLELVHRIDRDTSGLLMLAKKRAVLLQLQAQLRERITAKSYLAIVKGLWPRRTKTLRGALLKTRNASGERIVREDEDGQDAVTHVTGLRHANLPALGSFSLVRCAIETGRTHQIRVHLAQAGFPIIGDQKYGDFELNKLLGKRTFKRMYLHAFSLDICHPNAIDKLQLSAVMPAAFELFLIAAEAAPQLGGGLLEHGF